jgi:hypothetical protein
VSDVVDPAPPGPPGELSARAASSAGAAGPASSASSADARTSAIGRAAAAAIILSVLILIAVSAAGPNKVVVPLRAPAIGPPWSLGLHLSPVLVTIAMWTAVILGGAGVIAGIVAVARGARPSARLLVAGAFGATLVLAVLPPAGSTDTVDYAAYGRMVVLGHSPYVMTPAELRKDGDPVGRVAYRVAPIWRTSPSAYGPLATAEQWAAAELGGTSTARITFWLKLWNAVAFGAVVLALDRLLRSDPARRARAHLLWSVNPLLLWGLVAGGHVDATAAAFGLLGLLTAAAPRPGQAPHAMRALAAGVLVGAAIDMKATFVMFGLGLAWAARRSRAALLAAAAGGLAVLGPSYIWFGRPALAALTNRSAYATTDNLYQLFARALGYGWQSHLTPIATATFLAVALLLLWRLPVELPDLPAVRPALALSLAWLLTWPYQRPWYDAMAFCLLAIYPAARLDWPVLVRQIGGTLYYLPGRLGRIIGPLRKFPHEEEVLLMPALRLAVLLTVIGLALTSAWHRRLPAAAPTGAVTVKAATPGEAVAAPQGDPPSMAAPGPVPGPG